MDKLTYNEILALIDEYLEEPNSLDPKWVSALLVIREMPEKIRSLTREKSDLRNDLCLRCGNYKLAHYGACEGCRWNNECG